MQNLTFSEYKKNVEINNLFKNNVWLETNFSRGNNIENVHYRNEN